MDPRYSHRVNANQVDEYKPFFFQVEASDLRWPPGHFPKALLTDLGNGQMLVLVNVQEGECVTYRQLMGCITLTVWSD